MTIFSKEEDAQITKIFEKVAVDRAKEFWNGIRKLGFNAAKNGRRCPVCGSQSCTKAHDDCASCDTERSEW